MNDECFHPYFRFDLFLVSALISRQVYLYAAGAVCLICGLIWMWPRRKKKKEPKESGAGRYLS